MIPYVERLFKRSEAAYIPSAKAQGFTRPLITAFRNAGSTQNQGLFSGKEQRGFSFDPGFWAEPSL
jgi:hypothetical protein